MSDEETVADLTPPRILDAPLAQDPAVVVWLGLQVQRWIGYSIMALAAVYLMLGKFSFSVPILLWGLGLRFLPLIFGRYLSSFIFVMCVIAVFMGDGGTGSTFRPLAALMVLPLMLFAALLWSKRSAGTIAVLAVAAFNLVFRRKEAEA
ncbi:MAG: hypothetical protein AAGD92_13960 [Pseudomonadota bacterium]